MSDTQEPQKPKSASASAASREYSSVEKMAGHEAFGGSPNANDSSADVSGPPGEAAPSTATHAADDLAARDDSEGAAGLSDELAAALAEMQAEVAQLKDALVRSQAEMENVRRRATRDVESAHKFALEKFVDALIPVKDALDLGLTAASQAPDVESLREGVAMTAKMFDDMLVRIGVTEINPEGERFDPELHQAMTLIESPDHDANTVVTVMQKGFTLNGRLIRPAMVGVAKSST